MSFSVRKWRGAVTLAIVSAIFLSGCSDSPNKVVGDSNGWTIEQYKQAIAEQVKESEEPETAAAQKNE